MHSTSNQPKLNGFDCPKCGAEALDSSPLGVIHNDPPMLNIHCNYIGY